MSRHERSQTDAVSRTATRIEAALGQLRAVGSRVAREELSRFPATANDPRLRGPALTQPTIGHRKTSELLVAAGGEHLAEAAGGLAGWAGAAVALEDLESQLAVWLPEGTVSALAAAVTRRVLCDEAGLAATKWATHAVSVDALAKFTEAAMAVADDVGLIDTDALAGFAAEQGWADSVELLVEACGFVRLFERLAVRQSGRAACRAALLEMKHAATVAEIAESTGLTIETARKAASGYRIGRDRYAAHTDARFAEFTAAVRTVVDDVGLIDEAALREVGTASCDNLRRCPGREALGVSGSG